MRSSIFRPLAALAVAAAVASAAPIPATAGFDAASTLGVSLYCEADALNCEAYASGGTGAYGFSWTNASETYRDGAYSTAYPHCFGTTPGLVVRVTVSDGNGATATASQSMACP